MMKSFHLAHRLDGSKLDLFRIYRAQGGLERFEFEGGNRIDAIDLVA
jgi:hypothetical protein